MSNKVTHVMTNVFVQPSEVSYERATPITNDFGWPHLLHLGPEVTLFLSPAAMDALVATLRAALVPDEVDRGTGG